MLRRQTSSKKNTIWRPITESEFFKNVKKVHDACGEAPRPPQVFDRKVPAAAGAQVSSYKLPLEVEYQLANDLAFLAAASEGAMSVSATAVSEHAQSTGLAVTLASNAGVPRDVEEALSKICQELQRCSSTESRRRVCLESLVDIVIKLHRQRILGRIESMYWTPPAHIKTRPREPFYKIFLQAMQAQIGTRDGNNTEISAILQTSKDLQDTMDRLQGDQDLDGLRNLVKLASQLPGTYHSLAERLLSQNMAALAQSKLIKRVDKIGRYWACCERMVKMTSSRSYGHLFDSVIITALSPCEPRIVFKRERHTHAEVQIITYFRLCKTISKPRVIGISKATCYLCNLFLSHHPQYLVSATHGAIYEPWTIPDLDTYSKGDRTELRGIIAAMNRELIRQAKKRSRFPAPAQSGIFHPPPPFSASPASSRATILAEPTEHTTRGLSVLDPPGRERLEGAINTTGATHAGPYRQVGRSSFSPAQFKSRPRIDPRLQTISPFDLNPTSRPSPLPDSSSSEPLVLSHPCPSPSMRSDSFQAHQQLAVPAAPEAPTAPGISASTFNFGLGDATPEHEDWLEVYGMRLRFELDDVGPGNRVYSRHSPMGTAFINRLGETEMPVALRVVDVRSMIPGRDVILEKAGGAETLDFVLSNGSRGALQVVCRWHRQDT